MKRNQSIGLVLGLAFVLLWGAGDSAAGIVAPGGSPDPAFANLRLWFSAGSGVYADAGVTPAADGQAVQQWNNLATAAGAGSHAAAVNPPTFENGATDLIGGNPVVRFDGLNDYLNGSVTIGAPKTFFMVWKDTGTTATCCAGGIGTRTSGTGNYNGLMSVNSGGTSRAFADFPGAGFSGATSIINQPIIGSLTYQTTGTRIYVNGLIDASNASNWALSGTSYQIGTRNNELGRFLRGDVAEILVYDGALSAAEQDAVGTYLGSKYGVTYQTRASALAPDGTPNAHFEGLKLWLKADAAVFNVADSALAADGQTVAQWKNQAAGAAAASHAVGGANQPTFESGAGDTIGGLPVVRFDGINDELGGSISVTAAKTVFAVMKDTGTATTCCSGAVWLNGNNNAISTKAVGAESRLVLDWSGSGHTGPTNIKDQAIVAALTWNSTGSIYSQMFRNGVMEDIETSQNMAAAASAYKLGTRGGDGPLYNRWYKGDFAEVLVFDGQLGPVTRLGISRYLGSRYGIAVSNAVDEAMGSTLQVSAPGSDPAFGDKTQVVAALNFYNNALGTVGQGGAGDNGRMNGATVLGVKFDDVYVGTGALNGTVPLGANQSGVTLTMNMQNYSDREQTATIAGTDGASATRLLTDLKELTAGQTNELTLAGLDRDADLFVQLFGGDVGWSADVDVYANGTLAGRWTSAADNNTGTASTYGFFTKSDASGQLLLRFAAINVGGAGNANTAGLAALIVAERVPEPSTLVLVALGGAALAAGGLWRRRRVVAIWETR